MKIDLSEHLIWLTRGGDWGFRFLSRGQFSLEVVQELYRKVFGENGCGPKKCGGKITYGEHTYHYLAYRFYDKCQEWQDVAGRSIPHEMIVVYEGRRIQCSAEELMDCVRPFYTQQFVKKNEDVERLENCQFDLRIGSEVDTKEDSNIVIEGGRKVMAWNRPTQKIESESKATKRPRVWWGLGAGLIVVVAAVAGVVSFTAGTGTPPEKTAADEESAEELPKPKQSKMIREVAPAAAPVYNVVAEKLQGCKFLMNGQVKQKAKFYLCLFSASWCPPCRAEMPRIAKTYAETLKDDPDIELIHFSRDQDEEKAMAWAKEHDVKFPVVKPNGGNPLDLHTDGIPHLFIVKADGTLVEEGHPMRIFNEEKFREIKSGNMKPRVAERTDQCQQAHETTTNGVKWSYKIVDGGVVFKRRLLFGWKVGYSRGNVRCACYP